MKKFRQGDLLIKEVDKIPDGLNEKKDLKLISGSGASNEHCLTGGKIYEKQDGLLRGYFMIDKEEKVIHQTWDGKEAEHKPITLQKGVYSFFRQRTYLPNSYEIVQD